MVNSEMVYDATDRNGNSIESYPAMYKGAKLLGINGIGLAEYYDETQGSVFFAILSSDGNVIAPPPEYGLVHELPLDEYGWSLREYLTESPSERGEWRDISKFAEGIL